MLTQTVISLSNYIIILFTSALDNLIFTISDIFRFTFDKTFMGVIWLFGK